MRRGSWKYYTRTAAWPSCAALGYASTTELLDGPAVQLWGMPRGLLKATHHRDTCIPSSTAALFTIARKWGHLTSPSMSGWVKKMWCIDTMELC